MILFEFIFPPNGKNFLVRAKTAIIVPKTWRQNETELFNQHLNFLDKYAYFDGYFLKKLIKKKLNGLNKLNLSKRP